MADYYALLHTMLYRSSLSPVYNDNEMQAVVLESADRDRFDRWHITNAQVRIDSLQTKLAAVGSIEKQRSGISIRRENQSYSILVGFDFIGSYELSCRLIERTLKQFNEEVLPIGFTADSPTYQFAFGKKKTSRCGSSCSSWRSSTRCVPSSSNRCSNRWSSFS